MDRKRDSSVVIVLVLFHQSHAFCMFRCQTMVHVFLVSVGLFASPIWLTFF
jgi:hypothetical protein